MATPAANQAWTRRKQAARAFQPKRVRLLLVAEAPPGDGRYFYFEDATDDLFAEVCRVLFESDPPRNAGPWLHELRRRGVCVMELRPDAPSDGRPLAPYVGPLLINAETLAPEHVVLIGGAVFDAVHAKMQSSLPVVDVKVPWPDGVEFRQKLRQALVRAGLEKLIKPPSKKVLEQSGD